MQKCSIMAKVKEPNYFGITGGNDRQGKTFGRRAFAVMRPLRATSSIILERRSRRPAGSAESIRNRILPPPSVVRSISTAVFCCHVIVQSSRMEKGFSGNFSDNFASSCLSDSSAIAAEAAAAAAAVIASSRVYYSSSKGHSRHNMRPAGSPPPPPPPWAKEVTLKLAAGETESAPLPRDYS